MAIASRYCPSCLSSLSQQPFSFLRPAAIRSFLPTTSIASYHATPALQKQQGKSAKQKEKEAAAKRKKKARKHYLQPDLRNAMQFSLVDAMRYLRAAEVGRGPTSSKYELHVRLRTLKNGPVVRNRMRLPHPVKTDMRIAVICDPALPAAKIAAANGATYVGEETIFDAVREGRIDFDRCICHEGSTAKLNRANLGRVLGPRGLMPSAKTGTIVKDVGVAVRNMAGGSQYRERIGVVRMAIGQLGFTPEELQKNIKAFIDGIQADIALISDRMTKEIHEVVLSSTNGPGLSLTGDVRGPDSLPTKDLSTL